MKTKTNSKTKAKTTPAPTVQIELDNYLNWLYSDKDDISTSRFIEIIKNGAKPIREEVTTSIHLFAELGYLPARFVKNISKIRNNKHVKFVNRKAPKYNSEIQSDSRFAIEWV